MSWIQIDPCFPAEGLGFLWDILQREDKRPIKEQLEDRYAHGGGYCPFKGFTLDRSTMSLHYPGDPAFKPAAMAIFGAEEVYFYPQGSWLLILQSDGEFAVTRCD